MCKLSTPCEHRSLTAVLFTFLCGIAHAQTPCAFTGMVRLDDSTYIDRMEVSLGDWLATNFASQTSVRPDGTVLSRLPYRYFFSTQPPPERYRKVKGTFRGNSLVLKVDADSMRTKQQRYQAQRHLTYPIVGITLEQAKAYCGKLTDLCMEELGWSGNDTISVEFTLPSAELYDRMLSPKDSSNGECALFNYACTPCQHAPSGKDAFIHPGREITPVDGYAPDDLGLYNLRGNAAEMTMSPGIAKGGGYVHQAREAFTHAEQHYSQPASWLGFRCVAHIRQH